MIRAYLAALVVFLVLDGLWIGLFAAGLIEREIGGLLRAEPRLTVAVLFYLAYIAGIVRLAVVPAIEKGAMRVAVVNGALFGGLAFATYSLTNLAVLEGWSEILAMADVSWGAFVTAAAAMAGYFASGPARGRR